MDLATPIGFLLAIGMIVTGAAIEHVKLSSMLGPSAFLIVVGGSLGATVISHTMDDLKLVPQALKLAFAPPRLDYAGTIEQLYKHAEKARRSGLLALQDEVAKASSPLIRQGLVMTVDGAAPDVVEEILGSMLQSKVLLMKRAAKVFETAGGYSPTLGILGTVMGLVTIMGNLSEPDTLGPAIAVAFLATLYGVGFANIVFLPLGAKIKAATERQRAFDEMVIVGVVGLQTGDNPRMLREKLLVYAGPGAKRSAAAGEARTPSAAAGEGA
jgi:chemotaxis protein MotA